MQFLKLSFLLLFVLSIAACGGEDDDAAPSCTVADFVGTYTATSTCDDDDPGDDPADATITLTEFGDGLDLEIVETIDNGTITTTIDQPLTVTNCEANIRVTQDDIVGSYRIQLDGNRITVTETFQNADGNDVCTYVGTRN